MNIEACVICEHKPVVPHYHHVIPQAYGGKLGPIVLLCPECHTLLHAHATAVLTFERSGKTIGNFWSTTDVEVRALPLVSAIVKAAREYYNQDDAKRRYKIVCEFDAPTYKALKHLQKDLALSSLEKTLRYCVQHLYAAQGIPTIKKIKGRW